MSFDRIHVIIPARIIQNTQSTCVALLCICYRQLIKQPYTNDTTPTFTGEDGKNSSAVKSQLLTTTRHAKSQICAYI